MNRPGRARASRGVASRRGAVLMAVMLSVTMASIAVSVVLMRADAESSRTLAALRQLRARAAAWSGVRGVLSELAAQKAKLVEGGSPEITGSWIMAENRDTGNIAVRLVDLGVGEGQFVQAEGAKLNLNTAPEGSLGTGGWLTAAQAAEVVRMRGGQGITSVVYALGSLGIPAERMYGRVLSPDAARGGPEGGLGAAEASGLESGTAAGDAAGGTRAGGGVRDGAGGAASGGLSGGLSGGVSGGAILDVFSVFSFDPNVQVGIGADASQYSGSARINLGLGWSEDLVGPISKRFGADAVGTTKQLMQGGAKFKAMKDVVAVLRSLGVPTRQWGSLLDAFTTSPDPFIGGRIDLLRASAEVLGTVPGIDARAAGRIVDVRDRLDASARRELTWPLLEGILTEDQFQQAVDWLTNRTLQWRVIVEAGRVAPGVGSGAVELADRVVLEAVLDVSGASPRVAYLRDLSAMEAIRTFTGTEKSAGSQPAGLLAGAGSDEAEDAPAGSGGGMDPSLRLDPMKMDSGLHMDRMEMEAMKSDPLKLDTDLSLGGPAESGPNTTAVPEASAGTGHPGASVRGVDRRTGRWNAPRAEGGTP